MKKGLLIWNIVLTLVILGTVISACSTSNAQVADLYNRLQSQSITIQQLQNDVNTLESANQQLTQFVQNQTASLQDQINQLIIILNTQ